MTFSVLGLVAFLRLVLGGEQPLDWVLAGLVVLAGIAAAIHRKAVATLEASRRGEVESFARILTGLSRSVSPDAIVDAIVEELAGSTGADHVVVVRRRADARILEATLVSARPGVPNSTTVLPMSDLEDPIDAPRRRAGDLVGIPIDTGGVTMPALALAGTAGELRPMRSAGGDLPPAPGGPTHERHDVPEPDPLSAPEQRGPDIWGRHAGPAGTDDRHADLVAERLAMRVRSMYGLRDVIAAPLATDGDVIGAIVLSRRVADPWPATARRLLAGAAHEASMALSRAYSHRAAEARASTDALTGLPNRRYFDEFCGLLARRRRADDAVGVLMIDVDRFKALNDGHGHAVGDEVLRAVGAAIVTAVREDDVPARYGGEEFVVLLRNPTRDIAREVGERVRQAVRGLNVADLGVPLVTVSVGVAVADSPDQPIEALVEQADAALYRAKRAGRDRVIAA